jgi:hypothetical protein
MNRIPVGKVISESVNFSFHKYLSLLGVVWLPTLVSLLFTWFVMFPHFAADAAAVGGQRPAGLPLMFFAMEFVQLVVLAVMSVGVTKEALGLREGPRFVYLAVGIAELRVFGGYILLGVSTVVLAFVLIVIIAFVAVVLRVATGADPAAMLAMRAIVSLFVILGVMLPMLYFWIRLSSFLTAVSVVERRIGLWRSWALSRGNFWRLFAILLAIWIPLTVLNLITLGVTMDPVLAKMMAAVPAGPEAVRAAQREMFTSVASNLKYYMFLFLPFAPIFQGLIIAPGAFAYRALVPSVIDPAATFD